MNLMKNIRIRKLTLNIGTGKDKSNIEKGIKLLQTISKSKPITTITNKRVPAWGLRPGLPVGVKVTIRKDTTKLLKQLLDAKENTLVASCFDDNGNISFGIKEYIDIAEIKYDPDIGMMGLQVTVTLERPGYRIVKRKNKKSNLGKNHKISKQDAIDFMKNEFKVQLQEEIEEE